MSKRITLVVHHDFIEKHADYEGYPVDGLEIYKRRESPKLYRSDDRYPYRIKIDRPFRFKVIYTEVTPRDNTYTKELTKVYADEKIRVFKDGKEFFLKW